VAWSPNGRLLATTGEDKRIVVWNPETGERFAEEKHNFLPVWSVVWSPDGKFVSSSSGVYNSITVGAAIVWLVPEVPPAPTPAPARPMAKLATTSDEVIALVNGTLIDGTGAAPTRDAAVVIQKGRIVAVGARSQVKIPVDAKIVDVQGATILPGFINAHVHQGFSASNLKAWAQAGVTTVRDLGAFSSGDLFANRDALLKDNLNARLVVAGPMITVPGGYPIVPWGGTGLTVTSPEDASAKTKRLLDDGADVIKIALDSGGSFRMNIPILSAKETSAIVQTAHARGGWVSAHVLRTDDLARALDADVDDIAHMVEDSLPDQLAARVVKDEVYWTPTLELWKRVGQQTDRRAVANLSRFVKAGGKVALGTDYAGYNAVFDLGMPVTEIELLREAGMTPMQIIVAATSNAARVCNLDHELGTLAPGKIADVLIVDGDPLADLGSLTRVRMVIHNGVIIRK
jgi:imidazolonepropionase-like amidohydrolase